MKGVEVNYKLRCKKKEKYNLKKKGFKKSKLQKNLKVKV